jgi:hypothetical protein
MPKKVGLLNKKVSGVGALEAGLAFPKFAENSDTSKALCSQVAQFFLKTLLLLITDSRLPGRKAPLKTAISNMGYLQSVFFERLNH